jgi:hypothetical protein
VTRMLQARIPRAARPGGPRAGAGGVRRYRSRQPGSDRHSDRRSVVAVVAGMSDWTRLKRFAPGAA